MGPEVWGPVAAAVSALVLLAIKIYSAEREKRRKADNAISKRDREEARAGIAAIDADDERELRDQSVPPRHD